MQAVPSLVGTGTAVAAAAAGLVFAQPDCAPPDVQPPASARPSGHLERTHSSAGPPSAPRPPLSRPAAKSVSYVSVLAGTVTDDDSRYRNVSNGSSNTATTASSSSSRPRHILPSDASATPSSSTALPRSIASQGAVPGSWSSRRHSFLNKGEWIPPPISEVSRDSMSSNGSWIRRLSIRPLSQHGSQRSSVGPDSLSLNLSFNSAAPIVSQQSPMLPRQQSRNKLVKRTTAGQDATAAAPSRRGSRSQMPTLRRPATSHQRSATLQQAPRFDEPPCSPPVAERPKFSFDQRTRPSLAIFRLDAETTEPTDQEDAGEARAVGDRASNAQLESRGDDPLCPPRPTETETWQTRWTSFFHGRIAKATGLVRGSVPFSNENSPGGGSSSLPSRTIQVQQGQQPSAAYLTHASVLSAPRALVSEPPALAAPFQPFVSAPRDIKTAAEGDRPDMTASPRASSSSPQDTPSKKARRSISMNFSSPTSWASKTGSIRRTKRVADRDRTVTAAGVSGSPQAPYRLPATGSPANTKRHVSAPASSSRPTSAQVSHPIQMQMRSVTSPADPYLHSAPGGVFEQPTHDDMLSEQDQEVVGGGGPITSSLVDTRTVPTRRRNASSPLPPLSRLSSFDVEMSRLGAGSTPSVAISPMASSGPAARPGFATLPRSFPLVPRSRDISDERSSTLASSDLEIRGFASSGDDDDTDFKSDTVFDSIRTSASARLRSTDTPIESMFDESPPSTAGNSKTKRLSIQEILGQSLNSDTRIMEEDEGFSTPGRSITARLDRSLSTSSVMHQFDVYSAEANTMFVSTTMNVGVDGNSAHADQASYSRPSLDDLNDLDDDDDWARMDDSGVTNNLSAPSRSLHSSLGFNGFLYNSHDDTKTFDFQADYPHRSALSSISGNSLAEPGDSLDGIASGGRDRPRSNLFDWSESTVNLDKLDADGHSPRPKTVHGKQEMDVMRNGRPSNRKGPVVAHIRSQSVPVNVDPLEGSTKPSTGKYGTWATGPKNSNDAWDDDFDFGTNCGDDAFDGRDGFDSDADADLGPEGPASTMRSGKGSSAPFAMIVPASIQATQPTVKAHSGQIRELSLLVDGLKRLCRHARDLHIVDESPSLWKEAENIIALASPDEDLSETAVANPTAAKTAQTPDEDDVPRTSVELDSAGLDDLSVDGFDAQSLNNISAGNSDGRDDDLDGDASFDGSHVTHVPSTPPPREMSRTAVVRERQTVRRRSVFSPEDDIFGGGWPRPDDKAPSPARADKEVERPQTPNQFTNPTETPDSTMIESIMRAMQQQRSSSAPIRRSPVKQMSTSELFFNTNTLQELVKRANSLFHTLSDLVRHAELFTQSPVVTPRHDRLNRREDGSPAFTRVFTDPSSPSRRLPKSHSGNSVAAHTSASLESPPTNRVSERLQMMTVN